MTCTTPGRDLLVNGDWMDAVYCFMTAGGDPTMQILVPTFMYGAILIGMFIVGESPLIPAVVSIVLAGVIFAAFPANVVTIVLLMVLAVLTVGGQMLTWRLGR